METILSSETLVHILTTRDFISEDGNIRENLKSYFEKIIHKFVFTTYIFLQGIAKLSATNERKLIKVKESNIFR
jgi:hypothetical protein